MIHSAYSIVLRLLEAVGGFLVAGLGLDDREGEIAGVAEEVIGAATGLARRLVAADDDAAVGEIALLGDGMWRGVPARGLELRHDELAAGVSFVRHG